MWNSLAKQHSTNAEKGHGWGCNTASCLVCSWCLAAAWWVSGWVNRPQRRWATWWQVENLRAARRFRAITIDHREENSLGGNSQGLWRELSSSVKTWKSQCRARYKDDNIFHRGPNNTIIVQEMNISIGNLRRTLRAVYQFHKPSVHWVSTDLLWANFLRKATCITVKDQGVNLAVLW